MRRHLLVTNDFPPKIGGIQNYLWELWRRLPPESFVVYTTPYKGAAEWDAEQAYEVRRSTEPVLLPNPILRRRIDAVAAEVGAELIVLDPALPLGQIGPALHLPYGVVLHGAEVTVPGRLPVSKQLLGRVLRGAELVIAAGTYPAAEGEQAAGHPLPVTVVPPGVDVERFVPLDPAARSVARQRFGIAPDADLVVSVSRLVPRKGMDTLIRAAALLAPTHPSLEVVIAGAGRDRKRLDQLVAQTGAPVRFLGRIDDADVPAVYGMGDVFAMLCRVRWGGLEQEGFGIVFLEAAAAGVPQVAGASGGAADAVVHGETGLIVDPPDDPRRTAEALAQLLDDPDRRAAMADAGRRRAVAEFTYDLLATRLGRALGALA